LLSKKEGAAFAIMAFVFFFVGGENALKISGNAIPFAV